MAAAKAALLLVLARVRGEVEVRHCDLWVLGLGFGVWGPFLEVQGAHELIVTIG